MYLSNKKILVTGGTGFIGSAIVNRLINQECCVNIITLDKEFNWRIENKKDCNFYYLDLLNFSELTDCILEIKPEIIFHLAAYVNPERDLNNINKSISINYIGTKNLVLSLDRIKYDLLINTGTCEEYGNNIVPFKETSRENPVSPYSASKVATTYFCQMIANIYSKPIITVRPFLTYGPKQIVRLLIPWLIYSGIEKKKLSLTPCKQTRDFIFIEDLVEAYISLAQNVNKVKNLGIFNVGSGKEIEILKIVNLISKKLEDTKFLIGNKPYRQGETMHFYSSINKIKNIIGWEPQWTLEEGINKTIEWWQNNKEIWIKYRDIWK